MRLTKKQCQKPGNIFTVWLARTLVVAILPGIVVGTGCTTIPKMYDARTLRQGELNLMLGYNDYGKNDRVRTTSGLEESAVSAVPINYAAGYGLGGGLEIGGTIGGGHLGVYSKFQVFEGTSGFAGALYADIAGYGIMHGFAGIIANGGFLISYALPESVGADICWTTGLGLSHNKAGGGGYAGSASHLKQSTRGYIPLSMKVGKNGWALFGTIEYPVAEDMTYQVQEKPGVDYADVEYLAHQDFNYAFGVEYTR